MVKDCIKRVDEYGTYWAFRIREPSRFKKLRTPKWSRNAAQSISKDAFVTMGQTEAGNWLIQAIKIKKKGKSQEKARELALKIVELLNACPNK